MLKKTIDSDIFLPNRGLDVGTSYLIAAREYKDKPGKVMYSEFRDAFIRLKPNSPIAKKMMAKSLQGQQYFEDSDGSFIVVGQDAIERSIERNTSANRPLVRGVLSPKEKQARHILRHIFKEILGPPTQEGEKLLYSVPAQPVDQSSDEFDIGFHTDALNNDLRGLGYKAIPLYEAEAVAYSELEPYGYTGITCSAGAGMQNFCLMVAGEALLNFSVTRSGDWTDRMAAQATGYPDTVVQVEKEHSKFEVGVETPNNPILTAVSLYYARLIDYVVQHLVQQIKQAVNLPKLADPLPIIIAGGTSLAGGYVKYFDETLKKYLTDDFPIKIKEVRAASNQLRSVARGLLLASQLD